MKFTREEIRLCEEITRHYRKQIKYGDWYLMKTSKPEDITDVNYSYDKDGKRSRLNVRRQLRLLSICSPKALDIIPLWTWKDAREWLFSRSEVEVLTLRYYQILGISHKGYIAKVVILYANGRFYEAEGKTDTEAILKIVLAVLKEEAKKSGSESAEL